MGMRLLLPALLAAALSAGEPPLLRVVDFGADHGFGWYRNTQGGPWEDKVDIDGDGDTADDCLGGWPFSLERPLSPPAGDYDAWGPSAVFYGGAIGRFANKRMGLSEGHSNSNHEWRDDFNLMGLVPGADKTGFPPGMLLAADGCWLWRKDGFLAGGERWPVALGPGCRLAVRISRYWGGLDRGRFAVQDGEGLWLSEAAFGEQPGGDNGGDNAVTRRTHAIDPGATRWAAWRPQEKDLRFDAAAATWVQRSFADVRAVGFAVSRALAPPVTVTKGLLANQPLALKWNAVTVLARVARPEGACALLPATVTADGLIAAAGAVPFAAWERVRAWAVSNQHTCDGARGYSFDRDGQALAGTEPVHSISWLDAVAWCNALSVLDGRRPAYWVDAACTQPFQRVIERDDPTRHDEVPTVHLDPAADGWRLPTAVECAALPAAGPWVWAWPGGTAVPPSPRPACGAGALPAAWDGPVPLAIGRGAPLIGVRPVRGALARPGAAAAVWTVAPDAVLPARQPLADAALAARMREALAEVRRPGVASAVDAVAGYDGKALKGVATDGEPGGDLLVAGREVAWHDWAAVKAWAEGRGYRFDRDGRCGSVAIGDPARRHAEDEPVTTISWEDALLWCNALSELCGLEPAYRVGEPAGAPLRAAQRLRLDTWQQPQPGTKVLWPHRVALAAAASGWRLPTLAERERFAGTPGEGDWRPPRADGSTRPVGAGVAVDGLADLHGNAAEWLWQAGPCGLFGRPLGIGHAFSANPLSSRAFTMVDEHPLAVRPWLGFRVVRRP